MVEWLGAVSHKLAAHDAVHLFTYISDGVRYDPDTTARGQHSTGEGWGLLLDGSLCWVLLKRLERLRQQVEGFSCTARGGSLLIEQRN
eukprot:3438771-Pyramimonas_sp.AAC.1